MKDNEQKDADNSDPKTNESMPSGCEGVKAESGTTTTSTDDAKEAQDSTKKDEQTDQQSGPAE